MTALLDLHGPLIAVALSGAAAGFGLLACVAALLAARAARRGAAAAEAAMAAQLEEMSARLQLALAAGRGDDPAAALGALREDVMALTDHVSALVAGQMELHQVLGRAVKGALTDTEDQITATIEHTAAAQAERLDGAVARIEEGLGNVLVVLGDTLPGEAGASTVALAADGVGDSLGALAAQVAGLRADLAAAEDRLSAAMGRAPSIFDAGRVVSVVAPPGAAAPEIAAE